MEIPPSLTPDTQAADVIDDDVACRRCGYNLRGLSSTGCCPECAAPVGLSLSGDLLRYADPAWVDKLSRGTGYILWGMLFASAFGAYSRVSSGFLEPLLGQCLAFLGSLLAYAGAWLITKPERSGAREDRYVLARRVIRALLLAGLVGTFLRFGVGFPWPRSFTVALGSIGLLAVMLGTVGEIAKLMYLGKLALRMREYEYAGRAYLLQWGYGGGTLVMMLLMLGLPLLAARLMPVNNAKSFANCFTSLAGFAVFVFFVMYLRLLYQMKEAFRREAAIARETWARGEVDPAAADQI